MADSFDRIIAIIKTDAGQKHLMAIAMTFEEQRDHTADVVNGLMEMMSANANVLTQAEYRKRLAKVYAENGLDMLEVKAEEPTKQQFKLSMAGVTNVTAKTGYFLNVDHMFIAPKKDFAQPTQVADLTPTQRGGKILHFPGTNKRHTPAA